MALPASFVCVRVGQGKDERDGQGTGGGVEPGDVYSDYGWRLKMVQTTPI